MFLNSWKRKYAGVLMTLAAIGVGPVLLDGQGQQGSPAAGTIVPGYVLRAPTGSRADVRASGTYTDGTWTVLFTRALATAHTDEDRQFDDISDRATYSFGVAVLDNSGGDQESMLSQDPGVYTLGDEASTAQVKAREVMTAPAADPNDPNWSEPFTTMGGSPGSAAVPVTFRASFDDDFLYLLATWQDATGTENDLKEHWVFDGDRWVRQSDGHDEDRLAIWWDINVTDFATRGCWALCHKDIRMGSLIQGERADLWHWKATRTNPMGFADDQRLRDGTFDGIEMAGRRDDSGTGVEEDNEDASGGLPAFMGDSGLNPGPKYLIQLPEGAKRAIPFFQPAIFVGDDGLALVAHNADFSLVTSEEPLEPEEFAFVYASGLGPVGSGASGLPATLSEVGVTLAGLPCEVQFAGLAPGFGEVYQVNFRVPANAPSGSQDLILTVGGAASPAEKVPVR